jgi:hypothetical protein
VDAPPGSPSQRALETVATRARQIGGALGPAGASAIGIVFIALVVLFAQSSASGGKGAVRPVAAAGPASAELSQTEGDALDHMVGEMERLQAEQGIGQVPAAWLEGIYLAEASRFPDVREFWVKQRDFLREMQASEEQLFRESLTRRLAAKGLSDSQTAMQLAGALNDFRADQPRRAEVYRSMIELADAALDLHDLLVEHEDGISYEPAGPGLSREPITEAVPEDRRLAAEMNRRLDRLFDALETTQGSRIAPREELPGALRRGLTSNARASMR